MSSKQEPRSVQPVGDELAWMLVPSLIIGLLGTFAFIGWFASFYVNQLVAATAGCIALITATCVSLVVGAKVANLLFCHVRERTRWPIFGLLVLIISGIVFLLFLDAYALSKICGSHD